jgi:hypothetical protein
MLVLNTVFFTDDQVIVAGAEYEVQRAMCVLNSIAIKYNLRISVNKTNTMAV